MANVYFLNMYKIAKATRKRNTEQTRSDLSADFTFANDFQFKYVNYNGPNSEIARHAHRSNSIVLFSRYDF